MKSHFQVLSFSRNKKHLVFLSFEMGIINEKDFEKFHLLFEGKRGNWFAGIIMKLSAIDKVNQLYDRCCHYAGPKFAESLLNDLGVNYLIGNPERLKLLPEGAFVTISNHPYGGLDGIILIDLLAGIRGDYKFVINRILSRVKAMKENFISVTPQTNRQSGVSATSIKGIREILARLMDSHPVGFFPSGAVSDFNLKELQVRDREWQKNILSLIHSVKVPILPVRFFDLNSSLFYFLGLINWKIRLLRMPHEVFNKKKHLPRIGIGNLISVEEQKKYPDAESLGRHLRKSVYEMPFPESFISRSQLISAGNQPELSPPCSIL